MAKTAKNSLSKITKIGGSITKELSGSIYLVILSILLGIAGTLTVLFSSSALRMDIHSMLQVRFFKWSTPFVFLIIVFASYYFLRVVKGKLDRFNSYPISEKVDFTWRKPFMLNLAVWTIWFIVYFPGAGMNDTINTIISNKNPLQPWLYQSLIYWTIHSLEWFTGSITAAYALLVIIQMILLSFVFAKVVQWISKKGISSTAIKILTVFYSLFPIFGDFSITIIKDVPFCALFMLFVPMIYEIVDSKGEIIKNKRFFMYFAAVTVGLVVCRSNGIITVVLTLAALMLISKKKQRYILVLCFCIAALIITGAIEKKEFSENQKFREAVGVPFAQIAAVLNDENGVISEEDIAFLNKILPVDVWRSQYLYSLSDPIKFHPMFDLDFLNNNKIEFFAVWARILVHNLPTYFRAYFAQTFGLWNLNPMTVKVTDFTQTIFKRINNNTVADSPWGIYCDEIGLRNIQLLPDWLFRTCDAVLTTLLRVSLVLTPGLMLWIVLCCIFLCLSKKNYSVLICGMPVLATWLSMMISCPASFIYRHSFYLISVLPIVIEITWICILKSNIANKTIQDAEDVGKNEAAPKMTGPQPKDS